MVEPVVKRIEELRRQTKQHAAVAAGFIVDGDYSAAASECHRAYQKTLMADTLAAYSNG